MWVCESRNKSCRGQGVVEYAGALVIAAVLVAGALTFVPTPLGELWESIWDRVLAVITAAMDDGF